MQRRALTVEAMQVYAASFTGELQNQLPKIADPKDRVVQELLISYFYKGLHPEYLREKISHFKVSTIDQVFGCSENTVLRLWSRRQTFLRISSLAEKEGRTLHDSSDYSLVTVVWS